MGSDFLILEITVIIDSHMHTNFNGYSADTIIEYMDKNRIDLCWLLTWEEKKPAVPSRYENLSIEDVFNVYQKYPDRIIPMYAPDPSSPDSAKHLLFWKKKGIRGCGELKVSLNWQSPEVNNLLTCVSKLNIPLIFHMQNSEEFYIMDPNFSNIDKLLLRMFRTEWLHGIPRLVIEHISKIIPALKKKQKKFRQTFPGYLLDFGSLEVCLKNFKNINFVGHGPLFWAGISADNSLQEFPTGEIVGNGIIYKLLSEYDNLYADISGTSGYNVITRDIPYIKKFLSQFESKILFGTDNFHPTKHRELLDSLKLSERTYKLIYYQNAMKLVNR